VQKSYTNSGKPSPTSFSRYPSPFQASRTHRTAVLLMILSIGLITACGSINRVERDRFTHTIIDTLTASEVKNQPNSRPEGIIYPSSRTVTTERALLQYDSVVTREYPAFIRLALFEGVGMIGTLQTGNSTLLGLFGIFPEVDDILFGDPTTIPDRTLFTGQQLRLGIGEWKLDLFKDDPNWTYGLTAFEQISPDDDVENTLTGVGTLSVRKRWYLRDRIPYVAITPGLHFTAMPSSYVHANVSADVGSIAGVNLRLQAGYVFGQTTLIGGDARLVSFPYLGVGLGMFDFLNREEELEVEWKNHEHSGWQLSVLDFAFLGSSADSSFFSRKDPKTQTENPINGFTVSALTAKIALPFADYRFYAGTSLLNFTVAGIREYTLGVLPIQVGYRWNPGSGKLAIDPFVETAFAPSRYLQAGARVMLPIADQTSLQVVFGYLSGNTGSELLKNLSDRIQTSSSFSVFYIGVGARLFDRIFSRDELRYGRGLPHE